MNFGYRDRGICCNKTKRLRFVRTDIARLCDKIFSHSNDRATEQRMDYLSLCVIDCTHIQGKVKTKESRGWVRSVFENESNLKGNWCEVN